MIKRKTGIIAIFSYLDEVCDAMEKIKGRTDFEGHEVLSPTSYHELEHAADYAPSAVRWFTFTGTMTGLFTGFAMPLWMDYDWPLVVGGKTAGIYSVPAYFIFGFELMVLFGAIATILGMLWCGRLANPFAQIYDVRTTDDKFGVFVPNADISGDQAQLLKECGAEEVNVVS